MAAGSRQLRMDTAPSTLSIPSTQGCCMRRNRLRPGADLLEVKASPSAMTPLAAEISALTSANRPAITGTLRGNYISIGGDNRAADAPFPVQLDTAGAVFRLRPRSHSGGSNFCWLFPV